jgi:hypothetical protein
VGTWFEEGGYLPSESEEEASEERVVAAVGTGITESENTELSHTEGSELVPVEPAPTRLSATLTSSEKPEEGEVEWKRPDLSNWKPDTNLVLYGGARRGLGGNGDKKVGDSVIDLAATLHSNAQRRRKNEIATFHGPDVPGARKRRRCKPDLTLPREPLQTAADKRERDRRKQDLRNLKYDQGSKRWVFADNRVASQDEVQSYLALQVEENLEFGRRSVESSRSKGHTARRHREVQQNLVDRKKK